MKAFLLYADRDFDLDEELPAGGPALIQDLGLGTLFDAMAGGDPFLLEVARHAVLSSLADTDAITYRQRILTDCLEHAAVIREIYAVAVRAIEGEKKIYPSLVDYPDAILRRSVSVLELFVGMLRTLRQIAEDHAADFRSDGFAAFFGTLTRELGDDYFQVVEDHLRQLKFRSGVVLSAKLGKGGKGTGYVLRSPRRRRHSWLDRMSATNPASYTVRIPDGDESGAQALSELRDRGISLVANALAQSTDHILSFFTMLRCELGFYVGCLNLHERLASKGEPLSLPASLSPSRPVLSADGLYDVCLSLRLDRRAVGNDIDAAGKPLVMITGANEGGKSTFLRSVGLAQLMMQSGMFVGADSFSASVGQGLFTHFRREEDATMSSGKLDEELARMSEIVDGLTPHSIVLFNESFAATNEREGSEIARQVIRALLEAGVRVFFVTHLFDLAHSLYRQQTAAAVFLRAERQDDGERTFRLVEGRPLPTSYGDDLYERVFGPARTPASPR